MEALRQGKGVLRLNPVLTLPAGTLGGDGGLIWVDGSTAPSTLFFTDDTGISFQLNHLNASQGQMEAGTETGILGMSPLRVKQAIDALSGGGHTVSDRETNTRSSGAASDTLEIDDEWYSMTSASAKTVMFPLNADVAFGVGRTVVIYNDGAGELELLLKAGVTFTSPDSTDAGEFIILQGDAVAAKKDATDNWVLVGTMKGTSGIGDWVTITFETNWQDFDDASQTERTPQYRVITQGLVTFIEFNQAAIQYTAASAITSGTFWDASANGGFNILFDEMQPVTQMTSAGSLEDNGAVIRMHDEDDFNIETVGANITQNDVFYLPSGRFRVEDI